MKNSEKQLSPKCKAMDFEYRRAYPLIMIISRLLISLVFFVSNLHKYLNDTLNIKISEEMANSPNLKVNDKQLQTANQVYTMSDEILSVHLNL